jgi:hypothetical protein
MAERQTYKSKLYLAALILTTLTGIKPVIFDSNANNDYTETIPFVIYFTNLGG